MNIKQSTILELFLIMILPLVFSINIYLFVILAILQMLFFVRDIDGTKNKIVLLLLNSMLYSGITIAGMRIYDVIIAGIFIIILLKKQDKLIIPITIIPFILVVLLNTFIYDLEEYNLMEFARYLLSIIVFLITVNLGFTVDRITNKVKMIVFANLYFAIAVFFLMQNNLITENIEGLVSTNLYLSSMTLENRINGFFSDPNKYMTFCFALVIFIKTFIKKSSDKNIITIILFASSVISMSRTAIIVILLYLYIELFKWLKEKYRIIFIILSVMSLLAILIFLFVPDIFRTLINSIYVTTTYILGREQTLEINTNLEDDNRIFIWNMALNFISKNIIAGYGWLSYEWLMPYPPHNTILSLLLDGGLLALVAYILMFYPMIITKNSVLLIFYLIPTLTLDLGNYRVWFILLGLLMANSEMKKRSYIKK